jgi:hypothetical protein
MSYSFALFPRNFKKVLPKAVRGEGSWIVSPDGQRYLGASNPPPNNFANSYHHSKRIRTSAKVAASVFFSASNS